MGLASETSIEVGEMFQFKATSSVDPKPDRNTDCLIIKNIFFNERNIKTKKAHKQAWNYSLVTKLN